MIQLESEHLPARFCHTPMWDLSGSSLRQVREGDGDLQHFRSFVLRLEEREEDDDDDNDGVKGDLSLVD